jgi:hypothetical protein
MVGLKSIEDYNGLLAWPPIPLRQSLRRVTPLVTRQYFLRNRCWCDLPLKRVEECGKTSISLNLKHPIRHNLSHRVRIVRIDVEVMRLAKEVGERQFILAAVPFAANPSDAVHQAKSRLPSMTTRRDFGFSDYSFVTSTLSSSSSRYIRPLTTMTSSPSHQPSAV